VDNNPYKEKSTKTVSTLMACLIVAYSVPADPCSGTRVLVSITATNVVQSEQGSRTLITGGHVQETFNAVFTVKARFKEGDTISQDDVDTDWSCSNWSWNIEHGTEPTKVLFVAASTTCDAVVSHTAGGGDSTVSIGAKVTYTYNSVSKDDSSTGLCTFLQ